MITTIAPAAKPGMSSRVEHQAGKPGTVRAVQTDLPQAITRSGVNREKHGQLGAQGAQSGYQTAAIMMLSCRGLVREYADQYSPIGR